MTFSWTRTAPVRRLALAMVVAWCLAVVAARPVGMEVDFSRVIGELRALHGLNKGPLVAGGLIDLTLEFQELQPPSIRLHDCHWPNPDVVDIHAVFPDPKADPARWARICIGIVRHYNEGR